MNFGKSDFYYKLLYILIPFMNFTLLKNGSFRGIMLLEVVVILILLSNIKKLLTYKECFTIMCIVVIPWFWYPLIKDIGEFGLTYVTSIFYILLILVTAKRKANIEIIKYFLIGVSCLAIYGIIQFLIINSLNGNIVDIIREPFGNKFTFKMLPKSYFGDIMRANSLFYEPSIFGTYCIFAYSICLTFKEYNNKILKIIFILGILISFSATAYISLVIIFGVRILSIKNNLLSKYMLTIGGVLGIGYVFNLIIKDRISEIFYMGTSTYYRFIAPLRLINEIVIKQGNLFGIPLGQVSTYVEGKNYAFMLNGSTMTTSIDNAIAVIILYLGIISIPLIIIFFIYNKKYLCRRNIYLIISLGTLVLTTGGINFIYFNVLICIFIQCVKANRKCKIKKFKEVESVKLI